MWDVLVHVLKVTVQFLYIYYVKLQTSQNREVKIVTSFNLRDVTRVSHNKWLAALGGSLAD